MTFASHHSVRTAALLALGTLLAACSPDRLTTSTETNLPPAVFARIGADDGCAVPSVPEGQRVHAQLFATGTQGYYWTGSSWALMATRASLAATAQGNGQVATQAFMGFTAANGGSVVGQVLLRCQDAAAALDGFLATAVSHDGGGLFAGTTYIVRRHASGGAPPAAPGTYFGQQAESPFTAEYLFYRAR